MRLIPVLFASVSFVVPGCESDQSTEDTEYVFTESGSYVVGRDDYLHGVPDRTAMDRNVDQGGVGLPDGTSRAVMSDISTFDRTFIEEALLAGMFGIQGAQLALEREDDPHVKQIASMILDNYRKANKQLELIARRKGISVPTQLTSHYQKFLDLLSRSSDEDFTHIFQKIQQRAHEEAIRLYEIQSREGQDPELKTFAERTLPTLRKHIDHIQYFTPLREYNPRVDLI